MRQEFPNISMGEVYGQSDYIELWESIFKIETIIAETRGNRDNRMPVYEALVKSKEYEKVIRFCRHKILLEEEFRLIEKKHQNEVALAEKNRKRDIRNVILISIFSVILGVVLTKLFV